MARIVAVLALVFVAALTGCDGSPTEPVIREEVVEIGFDQTPVCVSGQTGDFAIIKIANGTKDDVVLSSFAVSPIGLAVPVFQLTALNGTTTLIPGTATKGQIVFQSELMVPTGREVKIRIHGVVNLPIVTSGIRFHFVLASYALVWDKRGSHKSVVLSKESGTITTTTNSTPCTPITVG